MKKNTFLLSAAMAACILLPGTVLAAGPKTYSGTVTRITPSGIVLSNSSAASYSPDLGNAVLTRKNGVAMQFSEILVGDKVQVTGLIWADNSISASSLRDMSLYTHNSTFSGKIIRIDPGAVSFVMQSKTYGDQTISTNNFTTFKKNGSSATFKDLILGMSVKAKGQWDRSSANILASQVQATIKMINIDFSGPLMSKNGEALIVVANGNVIYGVDTNKAALQDKNGKTLQLSKINTGDTLHVWGKHMSGSVSITATKIKDSTIALPKK